ncbi:MAG: hypothetical protein ABWY11_06945 [Umezawaea sp.]
MHAQSRRAGHHVRPQHEVPVVLTSAGAAAGIDLRLHVVRADHGTAGSMRLHLQAGLGVSPSAHRATFRGRWAGS